nr:VOC family protein [uncultured Flavobacterium sp.]
MKQKIAHIALLVADYDEAISFYVDKLHFDLIEDTILSETKRWVLVAPKGSQDFSLLLAKADGAIQKQSIGNQSGGRVFLFLNTDNFDRDYQNLVSNNIKIVREPKTEDYGKVLVFKDIYGNLWDLIQRNN